MSLGKKLYYTFIDFKRAFDTVWRLGLWQKLVKNNITGKILKVIFSMYISIKSCVKSGNETSWFFSCDIGVRQVENLLPFLFAVFLSDLEGYLCSHNMTGLQTLSEKCLENLRLYILLFVLLHADDTILLAESESDLQNSLNVFEDYCSLWKLTVNVEKTKIWIFTKLQRDYDYEFNLYGTNIEIVSSYYYLGLLFNYNCNFTIVRKKLSEQAQKALYAL